MAYLMTDGAETACACQKRQECGHHVEEKARSNNNREGPGQQRAKSAIKPASIDVVAESGRRARGII